MVVNKDSDFYSDGFEMVNCHCYQDSSYHNGKDYYRFTYATPYEWYRSFLAKKLSNVLLLTGVLFFCPGLRFHIYNYFHSKLLRFYSKRWGLDKKLVEKLNLDLMVKVKG